MWHMIVTDQQCRHGLAHSQYNSFTVQSSLLTCFTLRTFIQLMEIFSLKRGINCWDNSMKACTWLCGFCCAWVYKTTASDGIRRGFPSQRFISYATEGGRHERLHPKVNYIFENTLFRAASSNNRERLISAMDRWTSPRGGNHHCIFHAKSFQSDTMSNLPANLGLSMIGYFVSDVTCQRCIFRNMCRPTYYTRQKWLNPA